MPTSMVLAWFESRTARERVFADKALQTVLVPGQAESQAGSQATGQVRAAEAQVATSFDA
jgi:biopolymer transport protein ExbB